MQLSWKLFKNSSFPSTWLIAPHLLSHYPSSSLIFTFSLSQNLFKLSHLFSPSFNLEFLAKTLTFSPNYNSVEYLITIRPTHSPWSTEIKYMESSKLANKASFLFWLGKSKSAKMPKFHIFFPLRRCGWFWFVLGLWYKGRWEWKEAEKSIETDEWWGNGRELYWVWLWICVLEEGKSYIWFGCGYAFWRKENGGGERIKEEFGLRIFVNDGMIILK